MIQMPRRSVTRFFIPLIDVLILLFCIFLLMEFNSGTKADTESERAEEVAFENEKLAAELERRIKELHQFEELRPRLTELAELVMRIEQLENINQKDVQERMYFREINIDRNDGTISFHDAANPENPTVKIQSKDDADALMRRHAKEAGSRVVYYYFLFPVPRGKAPSGPQVSQYATWFTGKGVANNLPKGKKK